MIQEELVKHLKDSGRKTSFVIKINPDNQYHYKMIITRFHEFNFPNKIIKNME